MKVCLVDGQGKPHVAEGLQGIALADCRLVWVDVTDPSQEERTHLRDLFDLHPLAAERPLEREGMPRVMEFAGHVMVLWSMLRDAPETEKVETSTLYLILGEDFLITAHVDETPLIDAMFRRLGKEEKPRRDHPAAFLYAILNASVEEWFPLVEKLKDDIDDHMEEMLSDDKGGDIGRVISIKHKNMAARRTVSALRDVVMHLARRDLEAVPDDLNVYLLDIYDRLTRIYLEMDNNTDLISSSLDIHLSAVSNRLNVTMKRLTAIATFFMPATFLAGVYGMNFVHIPEYKWYYGYLYFWIFIVVVTAIMYFIARKQDWL